MYIYRLVTVHTKIIYFNLGLSLQVTEHGGHVAIMRCLCVRKQILSYFRKYFRTFVQSTTVYYGCTQYAATLHSTQLHTLKVPSSKIDYTQSSVHVVLLQALASQLVYYHSSYDSLASLSIFVRPEIDQTYTSQRQLDTDQTRYSCLHLRTKVQLRVHLGAHVHNGYLRRLPGSTPVYSSTCTPNKRV